MEANRHIELIELTPKLFSHRTGHVPFEDSLVLVKKVFDVYLLINSLNFVVKCLTVAKYS